MVTEQKKALFVTVPYSSTNGQLEGYRSTIQAAATRVCQESRWSGPRALTTVTLADWGNGKGHRTSSPPTHATSVLSHFYTESGTTNLYSSFINCALFLPLCFGHFVSAFPEHN